MTDTTPFLFARNVSSTEDLLTMQDIAGITGYTYWYIRALACGVEKGKKDKVPFPAHYTKMGRSKLWKRQQILNWVNEIQ